MKKLHIITLLLFGFIFQIGHAQITPIVNQVGSQSGWQFSPRVGLDIPTYSNNTPYVDYKSGIDLGLSADYYWSWFGLGADIDYINNSPKSTYPTVGLMNASSIPLTSFSLTENSISRFFYGIGPDFKYQNPSGKFSAEFNTRVGFASIKGGMTELRETTTLSKDLLNFHAGYDVKNQFSTKAQIRFNYFINNNFGFNIGAYYLTHFKVTESVSAVNGVSASYQPLKISPTSGGNMYDGGALSRVEPCNCDLSSVGVFAGIVYKIPLGVNKNEICEPIYGLAVTAKDKYTGELLADTEVLVKSKTSTIALSGKTNSFGVVVFEKMLPEDYTISGTLYNVALESTSASKAEFFKNTVVQKTILYTDNNFIVKGKAVECNSNTPIVNLSAVLEKDDQSYKQIALTDANGNFHVVLPVAGTYSLFGRKNGFFSQTEIITSSNYNRQKTLFVKIEICAEKVDCGKAINLKNILFDLDKYNIKDAAKPELNKLVRFMQDNPGVKVEVGSHTDCRSSSEYNQTLSQNRANASVDYVVSQGIDRSRISGKGYGESQLLNECGDGVNCSEAQHAINRRTEMKVICPEKN